MTRKILFFAVVSITLPVSILTAQNKYDRLHGHTSEELLLRDGKISREITLPGQKYLILDFVPVIGAFRRFRYFTGDDINFALKNKLGNLRAIVYDVADSSFSTVIFNEGSGLSEPVKVSFKDIRKIKTARRIPWITEGIFYFPIAGLLYLGASFLNRGIDGKRFTLDPGTMGVSGGLIGLGAVSYQLSFPSVKLNKRNSLKVTSTY